MLAALVAMISFVRVVLITPHVRRFEDKLVSSRSAHPFNLPEEFVKMPEPLPPWVLSAQASRSVKRPPARLPISPSKPVVLGFAAPWDADSLNSLAVHLSQLTHVSAEWFTLKGVEHRLSAEPSEELLDIVENSGTAFLPILANLDGDQRQPEAVETLAREPASKQRVFAHKLAKRLFAINAAGVWIDWEDLDSAYRTEITALIGNLSAVLHKHGLELWLTVSPGSDLKFLDFEDLTDDVDRFVAMLFYENGEEDLPGPIASQPWWDQWLEALLADTDASKWVAGIGAFGYDWEQDGPAAMISFTDAMGRARLAGRSAFENITPYYQPHFRYDINGNNHSVWFLDAITFRNQLRHARSDGCGGIAIYQLGWEDPAVWRLVQDPGLQPARIQHIRASKEIGHIGGGDFLTTSKSAGSGIRRIKSDETGLWRAEYRAFPGGRVLLHDGDPDPYQTAISFDDGPDPVWTPKILDILRETGVKASFFVLGSAALEHPGLLQRIAAEGHLLGNHTYWHPDLTHASAAWMTFELNATQRLIESATGSSTLLFRMPYDSGENLEDAAQFRILAAARRLGYMPVTYDIDSEDWNAADAETILSRIKQRRGEGNVILLHDGGGDRSATVQALPHIIAYLRMRGDEIVPLQTLLGVSRETLMPPLSQGDSPRARALTQTGLASLLMLEELSWAFLIVMTAVVVVRSAVVLILALLQHRRQRKAAPREAFTPPVSVIVAAFNEERVIAASLRSVLASDYPGRLEVVAVDDGSSDGTAAELAGLAAQDERVRFFTQPNLGKAKALDLAVSQSRYEHIVCMDADTHLTPSCITELVRPLAEEETGAVSGHVYVGNTRSWLTRFQSLEYVCGFNLDRRAYDYWNCIPVVPGAVSAFRRAALTVAGGLSPDTLAEDTDLTLTLHRLGFKVRFAAAAKAMTEAPETVRTLARQRVRWAFGTLQCLWKHRDLLLNPAFGALAFFTLPSMWVCNLFLVAVSPLVDAAVIFSLFYGSGAGLLGYVLLFIVIEWILAWMACLMEGENWRSSLLIIPMRFLYRPFLAWVVWVSIIRALKGVWVGWGKAERRGLIPQAAGHGSI